MDPLSSGAFRIDPTVSKLRFSDSSCSIWIIPIRKSRNNDFEILTLFKGVGSQSPQNRSQSLGTTIFGFVVIILTIVQYDNSKIVFFDPLTFNNNDFLPNLEIFNPCHLKEPFGQILGIRDHDFRIFESRISLYLFNLYRFSLYLQATQ